MQVKCNRVKTTMIALQRSMDFVHAIEKETTQQIIKTKRC